MNNMEKIKFLVGNKEIKKISLSPYDKEVLDFLGVENFDLDQNGKVDLVISYADPVTAFLDLNENGIHEIEYLFNGAERWIYFDENEDGNADFLFKDLDGDGIDEEVIKIEN